MNNKLELFKFKEKVVRIVIIDGEPWFVGMDLSEALKYSKPFNMYKLVDEEDKIDVNPKDYNIQTDNDQTNNLVLLSESGMFAAVFGSKLKEAKIFKRWVTSEVLPAIRKNGMYIIEDLKNRLTEKEAEAKILESTIYRLGVGASEDKQQYKKILDKQSLEIDQLNDTVKTGEFMITSVMSLSECKKDIKLFVTQVSRKETDSKIGCKKFYELYCKIRRHRNIPFILFDEIVRLNYFKINDDGVEYWKDITFK